MEKLADISAFERLQSNAIGFHSDLSVFNRACSGLTREGGRYPYVRFDVDDAVFDAIKAYAEPQTKFWRYEEPNPAILRRASLKLGETIVKEFAREPNIQPKNVAYCVANGIWNTVKSIYPKYAQKLGQPLYQAIYDWCVEVKRDFSDEFSRQRSKYLWEQEQSGQVKR